MGNKAALWLRSVLQWHLWHHGRFVARHAGKVLFVGLLVLSTFCVGLKSATVQTDVEKLWVEGNSLKFFIRLTHHLFIEEEKKKIEKKVNSINFNWFNLIGLKLIDLSLIQSHHHLLIENKVVNTINFNWFNLIELKLIELSLISHHWNQINLNGVYLLKNYFFKCN